MRRLGCLLVGVLMTLFHGVHCLSDCESAFCGANQGLTEVPSTIPVDVRKIFLQGNEISFIPPGIFSDHTQCQILHLNNNTVTELRPGMFDGLVSLWELKLSNNAISKIEPGTFLPLVNLIDLWLDGNEITKIDNKIWTEFGHLWYLYLQHNRINGMSTESFLNPEDHNDGQQNMPLWLCLDYNNFTDFQNSAFSGLKLEQMSLVGNKFSEISGDTWGVPQDVSRLDLQQNEITVVRSNAFLKLLNLESINLRVNKISIIEPGAFSGVAYKYFYLDLGANDVSELRGDMWNGISSIGTLALDGNKLTELKQDMWGEGLKSLVVLYLGYNKITGIKPGLFSPLSNLRSLTLTGNLLTEIDSNMWIGIKLLSYLDLGSNRISDIPNRSLPKLAARSFLFLDNNNLTTFSLDIFDPSKYKRRGGHPQNLILNITQNPLHCDHGLCWFKEGQQEGWITNTTNTWMAPDCANYPGVDWDGIDLQCEDGGSNGDTGIHGSGGGSGEIEGTGD